MAAPDYSQNLQNALDILYCANEDLFLSLVQIETSGALKAWNETVPMGETHSFEFELFKNSDDPNVKLIALLMERIDEVYDRIKNQNAINMQKYGHAS